jgi:hypothetical protein
MMRTELQGKLARGEDGLTAAVFSVLRWLPAAVGLFPFLREAFPMEDWDDGEAQLQFWPCFHDGTEPDVVLLTKGQAVVVEAKAGAGFGEQQLEREWHGLAEYFPARGRRPLLLALTDDATEPDAVREFRAALADDGAACAWLPWTAVAAILRDSRPELTAEQRSLVDELLDFLRLRGVHVDYIGISPEDNWALAAAARSASERVYPQIAALQPALLTRLSPAGIVWGDSQQRVIAPWSRSFSWPHQWGVNALYLPFRDASWPAQTDPTLVVLFDFFRARVCVGVRVSWPPDVAARTALLDALSGADGWRAVVGAWDVADHAQDVDVNGLTLDLAAEQAAFAARRTRGDVALWIYRPTPLHDAPLEWIATNLRLARDLVNSSSTLNHVSGTATPCAEELP